MRHFRDYQPSWYLLKTLFTQDVTDTSVNTCCRVEACIFGKASSVFGQKVFHMGILYQTESFLTGCISLVHEPDKP